LIILSVVVLPQPEGPINTKNSPSLILKLTLSTAILLAYRFVTFLNLITFSPSFPLQNSRPF
jgi:hypothetical protein